MSAADFRNIEALDDKGCCEGTTAATPLAIENRAYLSAIAYRVGTYSDFLKSMIAGLSDSQRPSLSALSTREPDDFTIALLDAWAVVADVLTFYQERIANEAYLRTATERASVIELSRLIGYELNPGVAASVDLVFSLEEAKGAPTEVEIPVGTRVQSLPGPSEKPQVYETTEAILARPEWNAMTPRMGEPQSFDMGLKELWLEGVATNLKPGDPILIVGAERKKDPTSERWDLRRLSTVEPDPTQNRTRVTWHEGLGWRRAGRTVRPAAENVKVHALRQRASVFGASAPDWSSLPKRFKTDYLKLAEDATSLPDDWPNFTLSAIAGSPSSLDTIDLDGRYSQVVKDSWIVVSTPDYEELYQVEDVAEDMRLGFTLSSKTTRLKLTGENLKEKFNKKIRHITVYVQSEELTITEKPVTSRIFGSTITLSQKIQTPEKGRKMFLIGTEEKSESSSIELVTLESADTVQGLTRLTFSEPLKGNYERGTVVVHANVAAATHGEKVKDEVLGSGDATAGHQRFTLRKSPLTYVSADVPSGGRSTLEIHVDNLLWKEVPSLFGRGPKERVYVTRRDDDGNTTIQFGDGRTGARVPTGSENVLANYRKGIGHEGLVKAEQLSLLLTRPLGVRAVKNPFASSGAKEPQSLADARTNAPLSVLTLDRIVSLRDFEDFARSFSGIAKASAAWIWSGDARAVLLTVAGDAGAAVKEYDKLHQSLLGAITKAGDPSVRVVIKSYSAATFDIYADVHVDADRISDKVLTDVKNALGDGFSFEQRSFGQGVWASEVIAAIQGVPGVKMVDLNSLVRKSGKAHPHDDKSYLGAYAPMSGEGTSEVGAAELLILASTALEGLRVIQ